MQGDGEGRGGKRAEELGERNSNKRRKVFVKK